ncbi:hypothetical protein [Robertkochia aurantiaca]|uniref:hypothetical protein n=1 Tax=Robertkochia aurantiaca TaxID=2873700 RepID=UPI001CC9D2D9|nr:hypothetical protein [Robertkochia sp. 3YJGBD-33]
MKNLLHLILVALLAYVVTLLTPWWGIMIAALVVGFLLPLNGFKSFFIPFLAVFNLWGLQAYMLSSRNDFTLAAKIADLFSLEGNSLLLILITALLGGLAAAFAALLGKQFRLVVSDPKG